MKWTNVMRSLRSDQSNDVAAPSRRDVLAGLGVAGLFAVAGSTLLAFPGEAEARVATPAIEPEAAPADAKGDANDRAGSEGDGTTEFSAQYRYGPRRRYWRRRRRRYWRRRRYYYWRRPYWRRRRYWRRRYWRRRYRW
jgi:hypothetical protein